MKYCEVFVCKNTDKVVTEKAFLPLFHFSMIPLRNDLQSCCALFHHASICWLCRVRLTADIVIQRPYAASTASYSIHSPTQCTASWNIASFWRRPQRLRIQNSQSIASEGTAVYGSVHNGSLWQWSIAPGDTASSDTIYPKRMWCHHRLAASTESENTKSSNTDTSNQKATSCTVLIQASYMYMCVKLRCIHSNLLDLRWKYLYIWFTSWINQQFVQDPFNHCRKSLSKIPLEENMRRNICILT